MIRAVIVEDEIYMQEEIQSKLQQFFSSEVTIIKKVTTVQEALSILERSEPDLLFLDIHLPDGTGFDLLEKTMYKNFEVIFVTAYDTRAIQAIKIGALDYILKPIDDNEFKEAVQKAIVLENRPNNRLHLSAAVAKDHFQGIEEKRIVLKTVDAIHAVGMDEILYCQADGNYSIVYLEDEKIVLSKHIKKIQELLPQSYFIRCHQSFLVNKIHVKKFNRRGFLILKCGAEVPVSGRRREFTLKHIFS